MKPQIGVVTLGVDDLERSLGFYRDGLGLPTKGIAADGCKGDDRHAAGAVVMFHLEGDLTLALYPRSELAKDAHHHWSSKLHRVQSWVPCRQQRRGGSY
ncbi:VOC family protein [Neorhizobium galegae]|uniref:VOC family protein n=1 Tax=Neorhizobium galegae TaxID=399 RepID=UPI00155F18D9